MGFRSLQHTTELRVHFLRALPARCVPPSGFGYPLDGLLPAIPCRLCFTPAALVGFTLRSFLLPKGIRCVSARKNPPTVSPGGIPDAKHQAGSTGYGSWVLALSEVPGGPHVFSTRPAGCSLGFRPSRVSSKSLGGISPDLLPRAWTFRPSHLGVSISPCLGQSGFHGKPWKANKPPLLGFRTTPVPSHSSPQRPSY